MEAGLRSDMTIGAIIQARMQSSRLPGKILIPLPFHSTKPLLSWPIEELKKCKLVDKIILATSIQPENDILKKFADDHSIFFFQGSEHDVLSRFIGIIKTRQLDIVIRITGDNPIVDIGLLEEIIDKHASGKYDYTYTVHLPLGMNMEVFNAKSLLLIEHNPDLTDQDKEHVTAYFKKATGFSVLCHSVFPESLTERIRLTVDYPLDYAALNIVVQTAMVKNLKGMELIRYIDKNNPWIWEINNARYQKKAYSSLEDEIPDALQMLREHDLKRSADLLSMKMNAKINN